MRQSRITLLLMALSLGSALLLAYVPDSGHGLVKDDFRWIVESRVTSVRDVGRLFSSDNGFYRPVVSLTDQPRLRRPACWCCWSCATSGRSMPASAPGSSAD